jgi:phosphatidylinositol-3-phosphatase
VDKLRWSCMALVLAVFCSACTGSSSGSDSSSARPSRASTGVSSKAAPSTTVTKLLVLVVENHSFDQMRSEMPYSFGLARKFSYATNYFAVAHPSLPNYLAMTSGSTHGISDDGPPSKHPLDSGSVFGQAAAHGKTAGLYADGMPSDCAQTDGGDNYAVKHNPWAYFTQERNACRSADRPLSALSKAVASGQLPNVGMVIPNMCHDAHNCKLRVADGWIRGVMQDVLSGPDWRSGHLAIVITADEDDRHHQNRILTIVVHPSQRSHVVAAQLNHYSLSRLYSDIVHAPPLAEAAHAPSMSDAFGLRLG